MVTDERWFDPLPFMLFFSLLTLVRTAGFTGMTVNFTAGILGGGIATLLTQPQDVIKTRMQLSRHKRGRKDKFPTAWVTMRRMFNEEGLYGFFRGSSPRFAKRCLGSAITWTIYEETVYFYDNLLGKRS